MCLSRLRCCCCLPCCFSRLGWLVCRLAGLGSCLRRFVAPPGCGGSVGLVGVGARSLCVFGPACLVSAYAGPKPGLALGRRNRVCPARLAADPRSVGNAFLLACTCGPGVVGAGWPRFGRLGAWFRAFCPVGLAVGALRFARRRPSQGLSLWRRGCAWAVVPGRASRSGAWDRAVRVVLVRLSRVSAAVTRSVGSQLVCRGLPLQHRRQRKNRL